MKSMKRKLRLKKAAMKEKLMKKKLKITRKLGAMLSLLVLGVVAGCATQPSRTQNMDVRNCNVIFLSEKGLPNPYEGDILSQNMVNDTGRDDIASPTHTVSPKTDVDVPLGMGGGESIGGLLDRMVRPSEPTASKPQTEVPCVGDDCGEK